MHQRFLGTFSDGGSEETVYYQRMTALAATPEIKSTLQLLKTTHEGLLAQSRVRPTPPGSPTPKLSPAKKKKQEQKHKKNRLKG
jgi:hypothetical protein